MLPGVSLRPYLREIFTIAGLLLVLLGFLFVVIWPWGTKPSVEKIAVVPDLPYAPTDTARVSAAETTAEPTTESMAVATALPPMPPPMVPRAEPPARHVASPPSPVTLERRPAPPPPPVTVVGRVDSWEDWNSSFTDTVVRTYSAIFDSARIDTLPGGRIVFSPTGRTTDYMRVKRIFCAVDSVRQLVKYTFPGESVDFALGVGFAAGVSLKGALTPRGRSFALRPFTPEERPDGDQAKEIRNQFVVVLNSPPGYAYSIRTGIEVADAGGETITYYTRPSSVEFRRIIAFHTLARDAGDTVLILTSNPKAIEEISQVVRRSFVNAVFVPSHDPSEAKPLLSASLPNVRLHVSSPRRLDQSFVVFNDSAAIVETSRPDPDFEHTGRLKLKPAQLNRIGYPRVTQFRDREESIEELRLLFLHYDRLQP